MRDRIRVTSKEYVGVPITEARGLDVTSYPVELSITVGTDPGAWFSGIWATVDEEPWAVVLVGAGTTPGQQTPGQRWVHARVTASPEVVVLTSSRRITFY